MGVGVDTGPGAGVGGFGSITGEAEPVAPGVDKDGVDPQPARIKDKLVSIMISNPEYEAFLLLKFELFPFLF